jgi:hypothetical protein
MPNTTLPNTTLKLPGSQAPRAAITSNATARMKLPYLVASQAQKEVTHNEALEIIDVLLHAFALAIENTPPDVPEKNDCYIIGTEPQGEWENYSNALAYYTTGWNFIEATEGMTVWVRSTRCHYTYDGTSWNRSFSGVCEKCTNSPDVELPVAISLPVAIVPKETCPAEDVVQAVTDPNESEEL